MTPPFQYRAFGGTLQSDLAFPELPATPLSPPDWVLRVAPGDQIPELDDVRRVGFDALDGDATITLAKDVRGVSRLTYTDTGVFDISPDGRDITWYRREVLEELVRMDVLSRVFATCFHRQGQLSVHASAVEHRGGAIAIIAPKFHGKSTLALALCLGGARLVTDDTLVLSPGAPVMCRPGIQAVRLRGEAATHLAPSMDTERDWTIRGDRVVTALGASSVVASPVPLRAMYLLSPEQPDPARPLVSRERLDVMTAGMSLVGNLKLGRLLEREGTLLGPALAVADAVPAWTLHLQRDLSRLDEAVQAILAWDYDAPRSPGGA